MSKDGKVINLRGARKAKARADAEKTAAENRVAFGRTKAERALSEAEKTRERAVLDAHRRARDSEGGGEEDS